jgi:hypothetical protein
MGYFSDTIAVMLAGDTVYMSQLAFFEFKTDPMRVWLGHGDLLAGGQTWKGLGELASVSGLEQATSGTAPTAEFMLSGVSPSLAAAAKNSSDEVKGRDVTVYLQFLQYDAGGNLQPLDNPYALYCGVMDQMTISLSGPSSRTIKLTAESLFNRRGMPLFGNLSDRDQQRLFPGDRGLDRIAQIPFKTATWPIITVTSK